MIVRARTPSTRPVPVPGGDAGPGPRRRDHAHPGRRRARRGPAVFSQQEPPGAEGLVTDDLLLEDRGHQGLEDPPGAADAQTLVPERQLAEDRMVDGEAGSVVVKAEPVGQAVEEPARAGSPGPGGHHRAARPGADAERPGAVRGQRGAPDRARPVGGVGRIAAAATVHRQGERHVDRERRLPLAAQPRERGRGRPGGSGRVRGHGVTRRRRSGPRSARAGCRARPGYRGPVRWPRRCRPRRRSPRRAAWRRAR